MSESLKVLVVDDSAIICEAIKKYLKSTELNIEVVGTAGNGKEALQLFSQLKPDIVTLDITMPEMDGLTVLQQMTQINNDVKVMVITALSDKGTGLKAMKLGAKSFLPKPFTEERLVEFFKRLIREN